MFPAQYHDRTDGSPEKTCQRKLKIESGKIESRLIDKREKSTWKMNEVGVLDRQRCVERVLGLCVDFSQLATIQFFGPFPPRPPYNSVYL